MSEQTGMCENGTGRGSRRRCRGGRVWLALGVGTTAAGASFSAVAQQSGDQSGSEGQDCIALMSIDHTEVIDDDTILFYMRDDEVFRNRLRNSCPGLTFDERFMYEVQSSRLCAVDLVTVVMDVGFGFRRGASCALGEFEPIGEGLAAQLSEKARED